MAIEQSDKLKGIHETALQQFNSIWSVAEEDRDLANRDRRFCYIAGAQWEGELASQYENKSKVEINLVHLAVIRIINEGRNQRIGVDFTSKDGAKNTKLADVCDGLHRADEQDSGAQEAYDNGDEEAVAGGYGAYRYTTEYEDEDDDSNDKQRIRIVPIYDADQTVFFDLDAKRQDKADAGHCFVITSMTQKAYEAEYDDTPASWTVSDEFGVYDWSTPEVVRVAEYYVIDKVPHEVHIYEHIDGSEERFTAAELEENPSLVGELKDTGAKLVDTKKTKRKEVRKYILSGGRVLEDCGVIAGRNIPVVPVYGKRWYVNGIERAMGHVRLSVDLQRLKNMQMSKLAEISTLSAVEKPIFAPEQVSDANVANRWLTDNQMNYPYQIVEPITNPDGSIAQQGPIGYTKPPIVPPAMAALLQTTDADIRAVLGNQEAGEELQPNVSGKAVELVQGKLDMQTYIYMSNRAKARKRGGEIWLSMAKDIYVEDDRVMKTSGKRGEVGAVELGKPVMGDNHQVIHQGDLSKANFDVSVDVGPSSTSKREAMVKSLVGMIQVTTDPESKLILESMAMMNMEGEGMSDINEFYRKKLVALGVLTPNEEDRKAAEEDAANQQPDPNAVFLAAEADKSTAQAEKTRAETEQISTKTTQIEADTIKTLSEVERGDRGEVVAFAQQLDEMNERDRQTAPPQVGEQLNGPPPVLNG